MKRRYFLSTMCKTLPIIAACRSVTKHSVTVYTALDEMYSRTILHEFEQMTGVDVRVVYDTEASKTTGLVTRLIAEKSRPRADVFWNNEVAQTILLKKKGVIQPYHSSSATPIPDGFKDLEGFWTGFAARARVIIYNTGMIETPPRTLMDLLDEKWKGKAAIALPLFGTTATHAAALFELWGEEKARNFFISLKQNKVAVLPGNATVRDMVASGEYAFGLTDTDDANGAVVDGRPAKWLFPDQGKDDLGTLVLPNTVALITGAPNVEAGRKLIDYLLSPGVEAKLAGMRSIQIPLNSKVKPPPNVPRLKKIKVMDVDFEKVAMRMESTARFIKSTFVE